jgi:hypothetical protein
MRRHKGSATTQSTSGIFNTSKAMNSSNPDDPHTINLLDQENVFVDSSALGTRKRSHKKGLSQTIQYS